MSELESCPFCGDDADDSAAWYTTPMTGGCINSDCPGFLGECITVERWNRRIDAYELGAVTQMIFDAMDRMDEAPGYAKKLAECAGVTNQDDDKKAALGPLVVMLLEKRFAEIRAAVEAAKE